jgi:hypothetical protein
VFIRSILLLSLCLSYAKGTEARTVDRKDPLFRIEADLLDFGELHFAYHQIGAKDLAKLYPELVDLDGAKLRKNRSANVAISKTSYIVNKPAGFFSSVQMSSPEWLQKILGMTLEKKVEDVFSSSEGDIKIYVDSDDLSSVKNSAFIHAVTQSKKLDTLSLSASSTVVYHGPEWMQIDNYIPYSPKKTMVISYRLEIVQKTESKKAQRLEFIKNLEARLSQAYP